MKLEAQAQDASISALHVCNIVQLYYTAHISYVNFNILHVTKSHVSNPVKNMGCGNAIVRASQSTNFYHPEHNKRE